MSRKTYEKIANINGMFNMLEQQIIHSQDMAHFRSEFFYVNHEHRENYEALLIYYKNNIDNPIVDGACYILALPEIFNSVDVFESELPFSWVYDENGITETMKSLSIPLQYLVAAALEVTDVNIFKPSGFTMGMNNWNIAQMRIFWQYTAIIRKEAL
ncbi:osmotic stress response protein [Staphylococcus aureus]